MRKHNIAIRHFVKRDLANFVDRVQPELAPEALNLALITDTHDRTQLSRTYYGPNGFWHVQEQHWLAGELPIDWRVHLGDMVDGSEPSFLTEWRLKNMVSDYAADITPFVIAKGNHDDNDKFAEKNRRFAGSFHPAVFNDAVFARMANQVGGPTVTRHGLSWFDTPQIRVVTLNTSDVPVRWINGRKNYDVKKTLAVTLGQIQELIQVLADAGDRDVLVLSHAPMINKSGKPALKYNGRAVHELLRAVNLHAKGTVNLGNHPDFGGQADFDFTSTSGNIIAVLSGHYHYEADYAVNGIHYSVQNVSALMGRHHALTTRFNRNFDRHINQTNEYAGYVVSVDPNQRTLTIFGYGAATPERRFAY
ncbi:metallophosphoesterase family protein [Lacticaseibacillus saniviri]|nr:metallophosphoesterase [Lacticaseibacillus saniviri]